MTKGTKRTLLWTPRILAILFAAFVSLFALDVFAEGVSIWQALLGLLIHLLPVYVLAIGIALGWRWEWVGGVTFAGFALWYLSMSWNRFDLVGTLIMAGVPLVIGLFYLYDWLNRAQLKAVT